MHTRTGAVRGRTPSHGKGWAVALRYWHSSFHFANQIYYRVTSPHYTVRACVCGTQGDLQFQAPAFITPGLPALGRLQLMPNGTRHLLLYHMRIQIQEHH